MSYPWAGSPPSANEVAPNPWGGWASPPPVHPGPPPAVFLPPLARPQVRTPGGAIAEAFAVWYLSIIVALCGGWMTIAIFLLVLGTFAFIGLVLSIVAFVVAGLFLLLALYVFLGIVLPCSAGEYARARPACTLNLVVTVVIAVLGSVVVLGLFLWGIVIITWAMRKRVSEAADELGQTFWGG